MSVSTRSEREVERVEVGRAEDVAALPKRVELSRASYFLVRSGDELRLLPGERAGDLARSAFFSGDASFVGDAVCCLVVCDAVFGLTASFVGCA